MAKIVKEKIPAKIVDTLSEDLIASINTKFKGQGHTAAYYLSDPNVATEVTQWIPTGCAPLDFAISNRPNGGYPVGKIIELTGLEACVTRDTIITVQILE